MTSLGRQSRKGFSSCGAGQKESTSSGFLETARREKSQLFCNLQELSKNCFVPLMFQCFNKQQVTCGSSSSGSAALRRHSSHRACEGIKFKTSFLLPCRSTPRILK